MEEVFFDIETKSWFDETGSNDPSGLGVSIVSVYRRKIGPNLVELKGEMFSFWEHQLHDMWQIFRSANRIIGFNTIGFDIPVLKPYAPADFAKLSHFDIYLKLKEQNDGKGAGLNAIAKDTLGNSKIDSGANAVLYWQKGDPASLALLKKYCEMDVVLTRDIYDFALKNKYLKFTDRWNNPRTANVDFSYPADLPATSQPSLF